MMNSVFKLLSFFLVIFTLLFLNGLMLWFGWNYIIQPIWVEVLPTITYVQAVLVEACYLMICSHGTKAKESISIDFDKSKGWTQILSTVTTKIMVLGIAYFLWLILI